MANDTPITVVGNLVEAPTIRFTTSGHAVATFTVASTPRTFNRQTGEWGDADTLFLRCTAWRDLAENAAESLSKGARVIAQGRLVQRTFETREGEKRSVVELQVDELGPSLAWAVATPQRRSPSSSGERPARGVPVDDPWAVGRPTDDMTRPF